MPHPSLPQQKRLNISILAALSITIMLFTVVHLRHFLPRPHHSVVRDCNSFFVSDYMECVALQKGSGDLGWREVEEDIDEGGNGKGEQDKAEAGIWAWVGEEQNVEDEKVAEEERHRAAKEDWL